MNNFINNDERFIANNNEYRITSSDGSNIQDSIKERKEYSNTKALEKYMPIGSVVKIKELGKFLMIVGFDYNNNNQKYDYIACEYPYGISMKYGYYNFNHEDIQKIYFVGYVNLLEKELKEAMNDNKLKTEK